MAFSDSVRALADGDFEVVDCGTVHVWQTCDRGVAHNISLERADLVKMITAMDGPRGADWQYVMETSLRRAKRVAVEYPRASVVVTVAMAIKRAMGGLTNLWWRRVSNA